MKSISCCVTESHNLIWNLMFSSDVDLWNSVWKVVRFKWQLQYIIIFLYVLCKRLSVFFKDQEGVVWYLWKALNVLFTGHVTKIQCPLKWEKVYSWVPGGYWTHGCFISIPLSVNWLTNYFSLNNTNYYFVHSWCRCLQPIYFPQIKYLKNQKKNNFAEREIESRRVETYRRQLHYH